MGRKSLEPGKRRSKQIIAKVTEEEHAKVYAKARRKKLTGSEFFRRALGLR